MKNLKALRDFKTSYNFTILQFLLRWTLLFVFELQVVADWIDLNLIYTQYLFYDSNKLLSRYLLYHLFPTFPFCLLLTTPKKKKTHKTMMRKNGSKLFFISEQNLKITCKRNDIWFLHYIENQLTNTKNGQ